MKVACLTGPRAISLREAPKPAVPPGGVVLRMEACGICGSDLRRWNEGPPAGVESLVQGHELAGTVVRVGAMAGRFSPGDRVAVAPDIHCGACPYCRRGLFNLCTGLRLLGITPGLDGGFAEEVVLSGDLLRDGIVHPMPSGLSFREGALAETIASVLAAHDRARTSLGETVVVLGAGPIGCLHVKVAGLRGARAIVAEPSPERRRAAERFGPERIIDVMSSDVVAEVLSATEGVGADVVICANPVASTQTQAVEMCRRGGRVILFGGLPRSDPTTRLDGNRIHYGEIQVLGAFSYHPSRHEEALGLLARKQLRAEDFITHVFPLSRIEEAFAVASSGKALKVVVEPDGAGGGETAGGRP